MSTKAERRVAILGDMFELGPDELKYHREVGEYAADKGVDLLIAVGKMAKQMCIGAKENKVNDKKIEIMHFESAETLKESIKDIVREGDVVIVKASNGMHLGIIADELCPEK